MTALSHDYRLSEAGIKHAEMEEHQRRLKESILSVPVSGKEILWFPAVVASVRALEVHSQAGGDPEVRILLGNYWLLRWRVTRQRSALRKSAEVLSDLEILTGVVTTAGAADALDAAAAQAQMDLKAEAEKIDRGEEGADPAAAIALSAFVLAHVRLAGADHVRVAQRNLAYAYWLAGRHQGSLDHLATALVLNLETVAAEPDDTSLSHQLIADIAGGVTVLAEAIPTQFLPGLQEHFVPRAHRYASEGYRPEVIYAGLGAVALTDWHANGAENALVEARKHLENAVAATGPGTEGYAGAKANLAVAVLMQARSSGQLDDFKHAIVHLNEAAELAGPDHPFYPNIQLDLASAFQQRSWGFGNPGDHTAARQAAARGYEAIRRHPIRGLRDLHRYVKHACSFADVADDAVAVADLLASIERLRHDWDEALATSAAASGKVDEAHGLLTLNLATHRDFEEGLLATAVADLTRAVSTAQLASEQRGRLAKLGQALELIGLHHPSPQAWTDLATVAEAMVELSSAGSAFEQAVAAHNLALARARQVTAEVDSGADQETYAAAVETIVELELGAVATGEIPARQRLQNAEATAAIIDRHWPEQSAPVWEAASALLAKVAAWYLPLPAREDILDRFADVATHATDRLLRSGAEDGVARALAVLRRDSHLLASAHRRLRQFDAARERDPELASRYQDLMPGILSNETWRTRSTWDGQRRFDAFQELELLIGNLGFAPDPSERTVDLGGEFLEDLAQTTVHLFAGPEHGWALVTGTKPAAVALNIASYELEGIAADVPALAEKEIQHLRATASGTKAGGDSELLETFRRLGAAVVRPVLETFGPCATTESVPKLHWVLHGRLGGLPLHVAVLGDITKLASTEPEYLLDQFEVTFGLTSAEPGPRDGINARPHPPSLLAIGAPDDGRKKLQQAETELAIADASGQWANSVLLTGRDATVEHTLDQLRKADAVHFALHGKASARHPSQSALYLTGGALTVEHLLQIDLSHVQLGNLSACQTGVVAADRLRGQSLSVATGFHLAGIPRVVAALWSIPDKTTLDFNTEFYRRIWADGEFRPDRAGAAVREAMIAVRDQGGYAAWPSIWAGLVLMRD